MSREASSSGGCRFESFMAHQRIQGVTVKAAALFRFQGIFQPHFQPKILPRRGIGGSFTSITELCLDIGSDEGAKEQQRERGIEYNYRRGAALPLRGDEGPLRR
jgi:hypothetical protein